MKERGKAQESHGDNKQVRCLDEPSHSVLATDRLQLPSHALTTEASIAPYLCVMKNEARLLLHDDCQLTIHVCCGVGCAPWCLVSRSAGLSCKSEDAVDGVAFFSSADL